MSHFRFFSPSLQLRMLGWQMGASHVPGTPMSASYVMCQDSLYDSPRWAPTTTLHSRGNLGRKAGRLIQGHQARKWHSAQATCLSRLLTSHCPPLHPEGKGGGEGVLRVPEELLGTREDRSWGHLTQSGPSSGQPARALGGRRVLCCWSSQKTVSSVPPPPLPDTLAAK